MRRITVMAVSTLAGLILLFSYRTSFGAGTAPGPGPVAAAPGIVPPPSGSAASGSAPGASAGTGSPAMTVNGTVARTRWGPVQVQISVAGGRITDIRALQQPHGNDRDAEINSYALPQLREQVLQAQNAHIDGVSGATVTSGGYIESLQAAMDAAHLGR
jgi:hypothetical protein